MRKFNISKPGTSGLLVFALFFMPPSATPGNQDMPADRGQDRGVWSAKKANAWYAGKGWLRGCDFIPSPGGQPVGDVAGAEL